jgi:hypothetical protein
MSPVDLVSTCFSTTSLHEITIYLFGTATSSGKCQRKWSRRLLDVMSTRTVSGSAPKPGPVRVEDRCRANQRRPATWPLSHSHMATSRAFNTHLASLYRSLMDSKPEHLSYQAERLSSATSVTLSRRGGLRIDHAWNQIHDQWSQFGREGVLWRLTF